MGWRGHLVQMVESPGWQCWRDFYALHDSRFAVVDGGGGAGRGMVDCTTQNRGPRKTTERPPRGRRAPRIRAAVFTQEDIRTRKRRRLRNTVGPDGTG